MSASRAIPFIAPTFPSADEIAGDYRAIVESNRFTNFGPYEQRFRSAISRFVDADAAHAVCFSNATAALQAASLACFPAATAAPRLLMPSFTFAAAGHVAVQRGHSPLFVDIERAGLQADAEHGAALLERHRGAVAGVLFANAFGIGAPNIEDWEALAKEHGLPLVIDSAAGFGSRYEDGARLGTRGVCEVFSFHATKPFAVGEGGAIVTTDPDLAERARRISNFGLDEHGEITLPGMNGKLDELTSAIGLRQLAALDTAIERRHAVLGAYRAALPGVQLPRNAERSALAFVPVVLPAGVARQDVRNELRREGIEARAYYVPALHRAPIFGPTGSSLPVTEEIEGRVLALPCHDLVTEDVVAAVAAVLNGGTS